MDQFEKQFEDLDVQAEYIENTMGQTTALTTPADQVDTLINQVAEEHGLEISEKQRNPQKVFSVHYFRNPPNQLDSFESVKCIDGRYLW